MAEGREEQRDEHMAKAIRFVVAAETAAKGFPDWPKVTAFAALATAHAAIAGAIPSEPIELTFGAVS